MSDWKMTGSYFKSCNCDPGCPCDFMSVPSHHTCEGVAGMTIEQGQFDGVSLDGVKWAIAYHWPGPLHEGNGTAKPYFDPATTPEQLEVMGKILMGQAGGTWFQVLASVITTVKQPAIVPLDFEFKGKTGRIKIGDKIENDFGPIKNPVTGVEASIQVRIKDCMEYSGDGEAEILQSQTLRSTDEIAFNYTGSHTSFVEHQAFGSRR
ncbi:MAG: hypothetical protein NVS2B7_30480 [Herpetosiphon sp.]